jgi:hypothetical protein
LCSAKNIFFIYIIYFATKSAAPSTLLPVVAVSLLPSGYSSSNPQIFVLMKVGSSTCSRGKMQEMSREIGRQMLFGVKVHVQ